MANIAQAPEVMKNRMSASSPSFLSLYGPAADVFSFGVLLWEIVAHRRPWAQLLANLTTPPCRATSVVFEAVGGGRRPRVTAAMRALVPAQYFELMSACWTQLPTERPSFTEALTQVKAMLQEVQREGSARDNGRVSIRGSPVVSRPHYASALDRDGVRHGWITIVAPSSKASSPGAIELVCT